MEKNKNKIPFHNRDINKEILLPGKWDKILTDYENYAKEYVENYKNSLKGCRLSLTNYPYMKEKSNALKKKLNKANEKGLLTAKQLAQILRVKLKTANACFEKKRP